MLSHLPPDIKIIPLSQICSDDRIVEESVVRFTHTLTMEWMLPGVPPYAANQLSPRGRRKS
jgi:carboxymethylenebutenolidase